MKRALLLVPFVLASPPAHAATEGATVPAPPPFRAEVKDPLLAPPPPARKLVTGWREALELLRKNSTDDRSAMAGVDRAAARWRQAMAALLPNARFSAALAVDLLHPLSPPPGAVGGATVDPTGETKPSGPGFGAGASLTQTIFDRGATRALDSAEAGQKSAEATVGDVRRRLTLGLARSLVAVVAAERVAELNRLGLKQALEREALTTRTQELGAATALDVVRVRQDVEVARGALVAGDEQLRRTRDALGLALGLDAEAGVPAAFDLSELVKDTEAQCRAVPKLEERADLVAAREQVRSAEEARKQAAAGSLPTVGLQTNVFAYATDPLPGRVGYWNLAAVLNIPLWEGGLREALVAERAGAVTQASEALERSRREVTFEVERSRRGVAVAESLLASARESRALADRTDQLTRRSFEEGRATSLELVQSAAALRLADVTLATREFELVQARLDAYLSEATCDW